MHSNISLGLQVDRLINSAFQKRKQSPPEVAQQVSCRMKMGNLVKELKKILGLKKKQKTLLVAKGRRGLSRRKITLILLLLN